MASELGGPRTVRTKVTTTAIFTTLALAMLGPALPTAAAHPAGHVSDGQAAAGEARRLLGPSATRLSNGLYRVRLADGTAIQTHGADSAGVLSPVTAPARLREIGPGSPERPLLCATGPRLRVLYAYQEGSPNRLTQFAPDFRATLRRTSALLASEGIASGGPTADYRVNCDVDGQITVDAFQVPAGTTSFTSIINSAVAAGFSDADVKYLTFFDATGACGIGTLYADARLTAANYNNGRGYSAVWHECWSGSAAMHEVGHNMGAVQPDAPHGTGDNGYHCWDEEDVMCYSPDGGAKHQQGEVVSCSEFERFDCGFDDYFDTAPELAIDYLYSNWNVGSPLNDFLAIGSQAPAAAFSTECRAGSALRCRFIDQTSDTGDSIVSRIWRYGDGAGGSGATTAHSYPGAGIYPARLVAGNSSGLTGHAQQLVNVPGADPLRSRQTLTTTAADGGGWRWFRVRIPQRARDLTVKTGARPCVGSGCSADVDLYLRRGRKPSSSAFRCASRRTGASERCRVRQPRRGPWLVGTRTRDGSKAGPFAIRVTLRMRRR